MRSLTRRSVNRPRPVLMLETLEDRRVMSVGGLLAALPPLATAQASPSPLLSTVSSLVAVPMTALSSVRATVQDLGTTALAAPVKTSAVDVPLSLNVDLPFLHVDNLRLDVGVNPVGSDQPLATLAVGGKTAVGSATDLPLNPAPEVQLGLGGTNVASQGVTASANVGGVQGILDAPAAGTTVALAGSATGAGLSLIPPTANASGATASNSPTTPPAAISGAPSFAAFLAAPRVIAVDGGGGDSGVDAASAVVPITGVPAADSAATAVAARPIDLGGGTDAEIVLANPNLELSGLTTRFQPYSLDGAGQNVGSLLKQVGPESSWLTAWLARLSHMAPWLTGLIALGTALEIRRRRRRAARALSQP